MLEYSIKKYMINKQQDSLEIPIKLCSKIIDFNIEWRSILYFFSCTLQENNVIYKIYLYGNVQIFYFSKTNINIVQ